MQKAYRIFRIICKAQLLSFATQKELEIFLKRENYFKEIITEIKGEQRLL
jgi:hypothetical protein